MDARRNLAAILEAAALLLSERPNASMGEIASAAGVHRATVHRHFASRDDLVSAVRQAAVDDSIAAAQGAIDAAPPRAIDGIAAVTRAVIEASDRYRLHRFTTWRDDTTVERGQAMNLVLEPLVQRAQAEGDLRATVTVPEAVIAWGGLIGAVTPMLANGVLDLEASTDLVMRMLRS